MNEDHIAQAKSAIYVSREYSYTQLSVAVAQAHALIAIAQELRRMNDRAEAQDEAISLEESVRIWGAG